MKNGSKTKDKVLEDIISNKIHQKILEDIKNRIMVLNPKEYARDMIILSSLLDVVDIVNEAFEVQVGEIPYIK